jgi:probable F420-dependent oxidoreductase
MDISLFARPNLAPSGDITAYLEIAKLADRAGLHSISFGEHIVVGEDTSRYPYGPWMHNPRTEWFDPLITLSAVAAVTTRLRLSTGILLAPLRGGLELAKAIATIDVVSAGRIEVGLGTGWQQEEYLALGLRWEDRFHRFDQAVESCRAAWGPQPFDLQIDGTRLENLVALPLPIQQRIPLLYGVRATAANARRIARLGDGWMPVWLGIDDLRAGIELIKDEFEKAGRDPASALFRVGLPLAMNDRGTLDVPQVFEPAESYIDLGINQLTVGFNHRLESLSEAEDMIESIAQAGAKLS